MVPTVNAITIESKIPEIIALEIAAQNNIVLVASAGNANTDIFSYPAADPFVIAVAATNQTIKQLNKVAVHQAYSPSTIAQQMMIEPVKSREKWRMKFIEAAQRLGDILVDNFNLNLEKPESGYFLFF